jgi:hypothetical protein
MRSQLMLSRSKYRLRYLIIFLDTKERPKNFRWDSLHDACSILSIQAHGGAKNSVVSDAMSLSNQ